jgi:magnesium transporter
VNSLDKGITEIMVPNVLAIPSTATLLEACELFVLHKFLAFPVVDEQRHICGVIDISFFAAEVFEMSEDEPHDEIFEAIGLHVDQLRNASPAKAFRHRFPWLLGTIGSGTICAFLGGAFEATLSEVVTVAFFLPLVLGLNESVAMQSMSLSLQTIHSNRKARLNFHSLRRELATSFLLSVGASIIAGVIAVAWRRSFSSALVLASTLLASLIIAGLVGFSIPLVLRLGSRDPKIAAGPIALAVVDVLALLLYFTLADLALR